MTLRWMAPCICVWVSMLHRMGCDANHVSGGKNENSDGRQEGAEGVSSQVALLRQMAPG